MQIGLTPFGLFHTLLSIVAVIAGLVSFAQAGRISPGDGAGKTYIAFTIASCVTALFIFHHGGFGPPHALAIMTLILLAVAAAARRTSWFGRASRYVETIGYSATFLFHWIPAVTETSTRLPVGAPLVANADAPELKLVYLVLLVLFLAGATRQGAKLHRDPMLWRR